MNKKCFYCGKETSGGVIEENNLMVDICDKCLIVQDYNPEEYKRRVQKWMLLRD